MRAPANAIDVTLGLRWSDQDANRHVNNATIITLIEEARVRAVAEKLGRAISPEEPHVVRSLEVVYDGEVSYEPDISAKVWTSRIGRTSYQVSHELIQGGRSCVFATTTIVAIDPSARRPSPLSEEYRAQLYQYFAEPNPDNPN
ncbi:acyl-CoA thioesterase [Corynebacterium striatum]|uniref:acyl-CoA thioesterase n=1 Tax=Corynebacterium striatum TaxID=43770 RepID=UPI003B5956FE